MRAGSSGRFGFTLLLLCAAGLAACGKPAGSPCSITGSGFTASHDCASQCLSRWAINCPDGNTITPGVCAGRKDCTPGSCSEGQVCYSFDDPFESRSYCVPDNVCGAPVSTEVQRRWERDSADAAAAQRAAWAAKFPQRSGITAPAASGEPTAREPEPPTP